MQRRRFGAHLGTGDGIRYAAVNARALGVEAMQIMVGEAHSWSPFKMTSETVNEFRKLAYGVAVYVHLPYTLNPCVGHGHPHYNIQRAAVRKYLDVCDAIGAVGVVMHPGYKKELGEEAARSNFLAFMDSITPSLQDMRMLIETDSGSKNGSKIGSPEFIGSVLEVLPRTSFAMCIDTEHLYARGVDLWDAQVRECFLNDYGGQIELVHLNAPDEGVELGSYLDKHQSEIQAYGRDSTGLITDLVSRYPTVVERRSLVVSEKDVEFVSTLVPPGQRGIMVDEEMNDDQDYHD